MSLAEPENVIKQMLVIVWYHNNVIVISYVLLL